ncbi:MAG: hypothetical protein Q4B73_01195 [Lachnospiraceae bacterium]|nr:hypothetical protein [Lachnospiraceae bacterium]
MNRKKLTGIAIAVLLTVALLLNIIFAIRSAERPEPPGFETAETVVLKAEMAAVDSEEIGDNETEQEEPEEPEEEDEEEEPSEEPKMVSEVYTTPDTPAGPGTAEGEGTGGEGEGGNEPAPGPEDDAEPVIVTDLSNRTVTYSELTDDILPFYAYIKNGTTNMQLRVKLRNSQTSMNGSYLTADGQNYEAKLARNEANVFTLYLRENNKTLHEVSYTIRYVAQKANEDQPEVGEHPPTVVTNLDSGNTTITNRNFTFLVQATTWQGKVIYADSLEVRLDGVIQRNPTGGPQYEYQFYFKDPEVGDTETHTVTVLAWDNEGNSVFKTYTITYHFIDDGDVIGTAWIVVDATTVGLGIMEEPYACEIRQNQPASYAVDEALKAMGYDIQTGGSLDSGYYVRRITRGGLMDFSHIPDLLWRLIQLDGLNLTGQQYADSLGEYDFTQGSGWMYAVNGALYAGKGLSGYYLSDGDTLYLRFSLCYGKDIGGYVAAGGSYGILSSYCGTWIGGQEIVSHQPGQETVIKEATCTEAGIKKSVCTVCEEELSNQPIEPYGHQYEVTSHVDPTESTDGYTAYKCSRCGNTYEETHPATGGGEPPVPPEPTPEPPPEPAPEPVPEGGEQAVNGKGGARRKEGENP